MKIFFIIIAVMNLLATNAIAIPKHRNTDLILKCKNMYTYKNKDFSTRVKTNGSAIIMLNGSEAILKDRLDIIWSLNLTHSQGDKDSYQYIYTKNTGKITQFSTIIFDYEEDLILLEYGTNSNERGKLTTAASCELV